MHPAHHILARVTSWAALQSEIERLPTEKQKGDCFELFVFYYLTLEPRYATKFERVWLLSEVPLEVGRVLNLPQADEGIDLVAKTKEGRYWAIQAKYRGPSDASLTRPELSTFTDLAFTICQNFDVALVCTTADRFSHKLELYGTRLTFCTGDAWRQLDREFFARLADSLQGKLTRPPPFVPRPHQASAIASARQHFVEQSESRGKLIMPCGTGKSLAGFWIARELGATRILVAVPSLALVRQTLLVWAREFLANGIDVHWIAVCSDPSVGDPEADDPLLLTQDLGVDVTTDATTVAAWLRRDATVKVVFSTYQSGRVLADAAREAQFEFDLGILDEAHRTVGKRDSLFSHLLFDDNVRVSRRVFMTATERLYARASNNRIVGMENTDVYGSVFEMLSFRAALEAVPPILSDYRVVTLVVTRQEIDALIERNAFVRPEGGRWDDEIEAQMLAAVVALRKAMVEFPISHALSFHSSIAKAKAFAANQINFTSTLPEFGPLAVFHVSGKTRTSDRDLRLREFAAGTRALMTNARCLSEGVDVPDIDCVLFADPKRSTVDIVQAVGRALRPSSDGGLAYILIPVEVEDVNDLAALQDAVFGSVLTVLRALAANDERIAEYFRTVSEGKRWSGTQIPFEIKLPLGIRLDVDQFVKAIELECWSRLGKLSWKPFSEAREFARTLGLSTIFEWAHYCYPGIAGKPPRPPDIPTDPQRVYRGHGWVSYSDWLGFEARRPPSWRPFEESREFARGLGFRSGRQWFDYVTGRLASTTPKPNDIPSNPSSVYADKGWSGWGDFLGTGNVSVFERTYRKFLAARRFARSLNLKKRDEWNDYTAGKRPDLPPVPDDIPRRPHEYYRDKGWITFGDFLGTGRVARGQYLPFSEARLFVRSLQLRTTTEWHEYCAGRTPHKGTRPSNIPRDPQRVYKGEGWSGFPDWLGNGGKQRAPRKNRKSWLPFEAARTFARSLGLRSGEDWERYCRGEIPGLPQRPDDVPPFPRKVYKGQGWIGYPDWVGRSWRPFAEVRAFARTLNLRSAVEWRKFKRGEMPARGVCPADMPTDPDQHYENSGWTNWPDFLGTEIVWRPFLEARAFARGLGLKSRREWKSYRTGLLTDKPPRPRDIPASPDVIYSKQGWVAWEDWLGCAKAKRGRQPRVSAPQPGAISDRSSNEDHG